MCGSRCKTRWAVQILAGYKGGMIVPRLVRLTMLSPLLKVPVLLSLCLWTYRGMSPPTRPSRPEEIERASVRDSIGSAPEAHRVAVAATKVRLCRLTP